MRSASVAGESRTRSASTPRRERAQRQEREAAGGARALPAASRRAFGQSSSPLGTDPDPTYKRYRAQPDPLSKGPVEGTALAVPMDLGGSDPSLPSPVVVDRGWSASTLHPERPAARRWDHGSTDAPASQGLLVVAWSAPLLEHLERIRRKNRAGRRAGSSRTRWPGIWPSRSPTATCRNSPSKRRPSCERGITYHERCLPGVQLASRAAESWQHPGAGAPRDTERQAGTHVEITPMDVVAGGHGLPLSAQHSSAASTAVS